MEDLEDVERFSKCGLVAFEHILKISNIEDVRFTSLCWFDPKVAQHLSEPLLCNWPPVIKHRPISFFVKHHCILKISRGPLWAIA